MISTETREKIITSDDFVLSEVDKLRVLYGLKKEIRYDQERVNESHTESVAEHIYALHCLIDYFLPLENPEGDWDALKIHQMAQYHDIDEIETGDTLGWLKSKAEQNNERKAAELVIEKLPDCLKEYIRDTLDEYKLQKSKESQFVKAIDKLEPLFQLYDDEGTETMHKNKTTRDKSDSIKYPYVNEFPTIKKFVEVITEKYVRNNDFYSKN